MIGIMQAWVTTYISLGKSIGRMAIAQKPLAKTNGFTLQRLIRLCDRYLIMGVQGRIFTKNPNQQTFAKAHILAAMLKAKVQRDEGEVYLPNGEIARIEVREIIKYPRWLLYLCLLSMSCFITMLFHIVTTGK
jgi:hypothetical protein